MSTETSNFLVSEAHLALDARRKEKSKQIEKRGDPIRLPNDALALAVHIHDQLAWIAEGTGLIRCIDLTSGSTVHIYRYHRAPVTSLAFYGDPSKDGIMISASWDKSIVVWNVSKETPISTTAAAHADFVKSLLVVQELGLLVSSGSDKVIRIWDFTPTIASKSLKCIGSISTHLRPVENMAYEVSDQGVVTLYTADTMGSIMSWALHKDSSQNGDTAVRAVQKHNFTHHRTRVNALAVGRGMLWSASSDDTVQITPTEPPPSTVGPAPVLSLAHPTAVRALLPLPLSTLHQNHPHFTYILSASGDTISIHEVSLPSNIDDLPEGTWAYEKLPETEFVRTLDDVHAHDVTALKMWMRSDEVWIVSASLDGTLRRWRLVDLINPAPLTKEEESISPPEASAVDQEKGATSDSGAFKLSEEEERELAELMDD